MGEWGEREWREGESESRERGEKEWGKRKWGKREWGKEGGESGVREGVRVERRSESGARVRVWQEKERWLERVGQQ